MPLSATTQTAQRPQRADPALLLVPHRQLAMFESGRIAHNMLHEYLDPHHMQQLEHVLELELVRGRQSSQPGAVLSGCRAVDMLHIY